MFRQDCRKHRQRLKEEQSAKEPTKKSSDQKRQKKTLDYTVEGETPEVSFISAVRRGKCKKRIKGKRPVQPAKYVSLFDILLRRIQPSLVARERLFNPRHESCFSEEMSSINRTKKPLEKFSRAPRLDATFRGRKRARLVDKRREDETGDKEQEFTGENVSDNGDPGADKSEENEVKGGKTKPKEGAERITRKKRRRKKSKFWCEKMSRGKRKVSEVVLSSSCESICSFDSDLCLEVFSVAEMRTWINQIKLWCLQESCRAANGIQEIVQVDSPNLPPTLLPPPSKRKYQAHFPSHIPTKLESLFRFVL